VGHSESTKGARTRPGRGRGGRGEIPSNGLENGWHDDVVDVGVDILEEGRVDLENDRLEVVEEDRHWVIVVFVTRLT
jgi:hypothetical protein